ncbi:MAG: PilZ domain-containing protein [bacterium]|nr:PilZ domain-containing protein [bacterium]
MRDEHDPAPPEAAALILYLQVLDAATGEELGRAVDLTGEGLRLVGQREIPVGSRHDLRILLPAGAAGRRGAYVTAVCRWAGRDVNPDLAATGFLFENPPPAARAIVARPAAQPGLLGR